jgi:hypothetical protein
MSDEDGREDLLFEMEELAAENENLNARVQELEDELYGAAGGGEVEEAARAQIAALEARNEELQEACKAASASGGGSADELAQMTQMTRQLEVRQVEIVRLQGTIGTLEAEKDELARNLNALDTAKAEYERKVGQHRAAIPPHPSNAKATLFYNNSADLARCVDELTALRRTSRDQARIIASLTSENQQLRAQFRLTRTVASPSRRPSRDPAGRRFDDRDVVVSRLEAQVQSLEDALAVYADAAAERTRRRRIRKRQDAEERRELAGPVDLTVAWRPKKNEISERTELLASRAAQRRRAQAAERKVIELEQRDIILGKHAKAAKTKRRRELRQRSDYQNIRQARILQLTREEQRREIERRREQEGKDGLGFDF